MTTTKTILVTGASHRIGAAIIQHAHRLSMNVIIHYHHSKKNAEALTRQLNLCRPDSACCIHADLNNLSALHSLSEQAVMRWGNLNVLVNNASSFYPTPIGNVDENIWNDLLSSNLKAPFFLAQALAKELAQSKGCIINISDIHAQRPMKNHTVYCVAKAGLVMLTKSLAWELSPDIRVNAIAPGAILWPENNSLTATEKGDIQTKIPLQKLGGAEAIANTAMFLIHQAEYITGQIIAVDGGKSIVT